MKIQKRKKHLLQNCDKVLILKYAHINPKKQINFLSAAIPLKFIDFHDAIRNVRFEKNMEIQMILKK